MSMSGWPEWGNNTCGSKIDCGFLWAGFHRCCPQGTVCTQNTTPGGIGGLKLCCDPRDGRCLNSVINNGPFCADSKQILYQNPINQAYFCCDKNLAGYLSGLTQGCAGPEYSYIRNIQPPESAISPLVAAHKPTLSGTLVIPVNQQTTPTPNSKTILTTSILSIEDSNSVLTITFAGAGSLPSSSDPPSDSSFDSSYGSAFKSEYPSTSLSSYQPSHQHPQSSLNSTSNSASNSASNPTLNTPHSSFPRSAIAGIVTGILLLILFVVAFFIYRKKRKDYNTNQQSNIPELSDTSSSRLLMTPRYAYFRNNSLTAEEPERQYNAIQDNHPVIQRHELSSQNYQPTTTQAYQPPPQAHVANSSPSMRRISLKNHEREQEFTFTPISPYSFSSQGNRHLQGLNLHSPPAYEPRQIGLNMDTQIDSESGHSYKRF